MIEEYDEPQYFCPECDSDKIDENGRPDENGRQMCICDACNARWYEQSAELVYEDDDE